MPEYFSTVEFLNDQRAAWEDEFADEYTDALQWKLVYGKDAAANMDGGDCSYQPVMPCGA